MSDRTKQNAKMSQSKLGTPAPSFPPPPLTVEIQNAGGINPRFFQENRPPSKPVASQPSVSGSTSEVTSEDSPELKHCLESLSKQFHDLSQRERWQSDVTRMFEDLAPLLSASSNFTTDHIKDLIALAISKKYFDIEPLPKHLIRPLPSALGELLGLVLHYAKAALPAYKFMFIDLGINIFNIYLIQDLTQGQQFRFYKNLKNSLHSSELTKISKEPIHQLFFQKCFEQAIRIADTDLVESILNMESALLPITFSHMKLTYNTLCSAFSHPRESEYTQEKIKIFNLLLREYHFSQEELDRSLGIVASQLHIPEAIVIKLLELGASPNYIHKNPSADCCSSDVEEKHSTALLEACNGAIDSEFNRCARQCEIKSHINTVKRLLANGANPNLIIDDAGQTIFHCVVKRLCSTGGYTKLYPLPNNFYSTILKTLIQNGADPFIQNAHGLNSFDLAGGNKKIFESLCNRYNPERASCVLL